MATLIGVVLGSSFATILVTVLSIAFGAALGHGIQKIVIRRLGL